jgi:hypothetical protein
MSAAAEAAKVNREHRDDAARPQPENAGGSSRETVLEWGETSLSADG